MSDPQAIQSLASGERRRPENHPSSGRLRPWLAKLCLLLGALALALLLGEAAVRVLGIDRPVRDTGIAPHSLWHHWHRANYDLQYNIVNEGFTQTVHFNEHGMRDSRPATFEKSAGVMRVAALGDSFVEGLQVEEGLTVCKQLEQCLTVESNRPVEVLNFACSGFSSITEYAILNQFASRFAPDLVICFHHFSDMTEDWQLPPASTWKDAPGPVRQQASALLQHSQLYRLGAEWASQRRRDRGPPPDASLQASFDAVVHDPYTQEDEDAWRHSLAYLGRIAQWCESHQVPFVVVLISIGTQVEPVSPEFATRMGFRYLAGGRRLANDSYQRRVGEYCRQSGIHYLDLLPGFRVANPTGRQWLYLPRDQHWTAAGHDLAARSVASYILLNGKIPIAERSNGTRPHW